MKTRSDFTFKPIDNVSLLQRLCMGFNVSFGLNQMSQYIDENGNPTQKAIDLFAKNIKNAHKSPLFLEHIPTFTSWINIGEKIKTSIDLAGVDYYCDCVDGVDGAFHYTISLYAALVLHNDKRLGVEFRKPIVDGLEQEFPFILKIWKEYQIKKQEEEKVLTEAELQLYNKHSIIRRHFQIEIPFFIANEFKRHIQGLAFTEVSFRYCNNEKEFYILPEYLETDLLPEKLPIARQGRSKTLVNEIKISHEIQYKELCGDSVIVNVVDGDYTKDLNFGMSEILEKTYDYYEANKNIIAPEVLRNLLPQCTYTLMMISMSDTCAARMCGLRLTKYALPEFQVFAKQIRDYYITVCPEFDQLIEISKKKN